MANSALHRSAVLHCSAWYRETPTGDSKLAPCNRLPVLHILKIMQVQSLAAKSKKINPVQDGS